MLDKPKEAMLYEKGEENKVRCNLCSHRCLIPDGERGICQVRENRDGTLYSFVYGRLVSKAVDPIEKKPLFHFLPGSLAYSIATVGCNFKCLHCQNYTISQYPNEHGGKIIGEYIPPEDVVEDACARGCETIAHTYIEPTIFFEYAYDIGKLSRKRGIRNVFVTNGFMTEEALKTLEPYLDGINVDLKSYRDEFYKKVEGGRLQPVLDNIKLMHELGIWMEVTTLVIPGLNDSEKELKNIAEFIKSVDPGIPWHVTRFHPAYQMIDVASTPVATLKKAREIGKKAGLRYVYQGNVPGEGEDTICYNCNKVLVKRYGFGLSKNLIQDGQCPECGAKIDGLF